MPPLWRRWPRTNFRAPKCSRHTNAGGQSQMHSHRLRPRSHRAKTPSSLHLTTLHTCTLAALARTTNALAKMLPTRDARLSRRHRKLSSGPKRSQRGYPSETRHVAEKITNQPPPPSFELPTDPRMAQFHQTTSAAFKFLAAEPRDVHSQDQTSADGYEFTQPLYSSFSADKTFQPRKLPPRPPYDIGAATRERTIPSTMTGGRSSAPLRHNVLPMASEGSVSHTGLRPATAN